MFSEVTNGSFTPVKLPVGCYSSSATAKDAKLFAEVKILSCFSDFIPWF